MRAGSESPLNWVVEQVASGAIPSALARTFPVEEIQDAHRLLDAGTAGGKLVVTFGTESP